MIISTSPFMNCVTVWHIWCQVYNKYACSILKILVVIRIPQVPTQRQVLFFLNYIDSSSPRVATDWVNTLHPRDSHAAPSLAMICRQWSLGTSSLPKQDGESLLAGTLPFFCIYLEWHINVTDGVIVTVLQLLRGWIPQAKDSREESQKPGPRWYT